jgi:mannose-6-phosphate isomerase class I
MGHSTVSALNRPESSARRAGGGVRVKHEAWYVIDAAPGAWILRGGKAGVDAAWFRAALEAGRVEEVLNRIPVRPGHAYYTPSGTVYALGPGRRRAKGLPSRCGSASAIPCCYRRGCETAG